jgi:hypothetical protein
MKEWVSLAVVVLVANAALGQVRSSSTSGAVSGLGGDGAAGRTFARVDDGWLANTQVIDGRDHTAYKIVLVSTRDVPESASGIGEIAAPSCGSPATLEDAWTSSLECVGACAGASEGYRFGPDSDPTSIDGRDVCFIDLVKVPASGLPNGFLADIVVVRSAPKTPDDPSGEDICLPNPSRDSLPVLFIDDAEFPALPANVTGCSFQAVLGLSLPGAAERLAQACPGQPECGFDWFEVAEFDPSACPDVDGDGSPDVGITILDGGRATLVCVTPTTDVIGADVLGFVAAGRQGESRCLNVLEAHPPIPRRDFPDVLPGEDGLTRPWRFIMEIPSGFDGNGSSGGPKDDGAIQQGKGPGPRSNG